MCDLTEPLDLNPPTASHHLKVLVDAGLLPRDSAPRGLFLLCRAPPGRRRRHPCKTVTSSVAIRDLERADWPAARHISATLRHRPRCVPPKTPAPAGDAVGLPDLVDSDLPLVSCSMAGRSRYDRGQGNRRPVPLLIYSLSRRSLLTKYLSSSMPPERNRFGSRLHASIGLSL